MRNSAAVLGILGDGQLALMLGESAHQHGFSFLAFSENADSSFATRFPQNFTADFEEFKLRASVITLENEFYSVESLKNLNTVPNSFSYQFFESKISQRKLYDSLLIPGPNWFEMNAESNLQFPMVLKKSAGGYDGNGVKMVNSPAELANALQEFDAPRNPLLAEEKVEIIREFAQGALFDGEGGLNYLPLVETIQRNGICELVLSRSTLYIEEFQKVETEIREYLRRLAKAGLKGLFNFEFFYTKDGRVLINEGAPRPHNSQHLTLDASPISQFDLLVRFCMEGKLPFPDGSVIPAEPGVMINLLGQSSGSDYQLKLPSFEKELVVKAKLYLKKECRPGRKMGHLNLIDPGGKWDLKQLGERALKEYRL